MSDWNIFKTEKTQTQINQGYKIMLDEKNVQNNFKIQRKFKFRNYIYSAQLLTLYKNS